MYVVLRREPDESPHETAVSQGDRIDRISQHPEDPLLGKQMGSALNLTETPAAECGRQAPLPSDFGGRIRRILRANAMAAIGGTARHMSRHAPLPARSRTGAMLRITSMG